MIILIISAPVLPRPTSYGGSLPRLLGSAPGGVSEVQGLGLLELRVEGFWSLGLGVVRVFLALGVKVWVDYSGSYIV